MNMTIEQLQAQLAQLQAENAKLKGAKGGPRKLSAKVSVKGAVSVYGLQRFPVTLFANQWARLFEARETIEAFIRENEASLSVKPDGKTDIKTDAA